jgi:hypothetical protein
MSFVCALFVPFVCCRKVQQESENSYAPEPIYNHVLALPPRWARCSPLWLHMVI